QPSDRESSARSAAWPFESSSGSKSVVSPETGHSTGCCDGWVVTPRASRQFLRLRPCIGAYRRDRPCMDKQGKVDSIGRRYGWSSDSTLAQITSLYTGGASCRQIGALFGVSG